MYVARTVVVLLTAVISIVVPKFSSFLGLSGAFSMTTLAFIMPVSLINYSTLLLALNVQQSI